MRNFDFVCFLDDWIFLCQASISCACACLPTTTPQYQFDGDAADLYSGVNNGFVIDEPLAALSDDELLAHLTILPANLGGGEGGGGLAGGTAEAFAAFGKEVLQVRSLLELAVYGGGGGYFGSDGLLICCAHHMYVCTSGLPHPTHAAAPRGPPGQRQRQ